jgi:putative radical SAM enzyme (TIGR03279 family)
LAAEPGEGGGGARALPVAAVEAAAQRSGMRPGDCIARLNGAIPIDVLDLEMAAADGALWLSVLRDGRLLDLVVDPRPGEWHGISLGCDGLGAEPRTCGNACRFCFVDQVPAGLRPALSFKDDDYRLSFLHGNFITLSNLAEADLARIEELRLSPLYVSLHAWDDEERVRLMGRAAADSRRTLQRLTRAGIDLHLQVVLCPGWNDGAILAETVAMAGALPAVVDLGIVPVSLAEEGDLRRVTPDDARAILEAVAGWQSGFRVSRGHDFVHAADEFHLLCGELPPRSDAPDQYENGIGISAELLAEVEALAGRRRQAGLRATAVRLLSGTLAAPVISRAADALGGHYRVPVRPLEVPNRLFGPHVTVTGLLGGSEVLEALRRDPLAAGEWLLAPRLFLPAALGRTLDDVGEDELAAACDGRLAVVESLTEGFGRLSG